MTYYYAFVDSNNIVTGVYEMPTPITNDGYIPITQDQYENGNLVGKMYDASTGQFITPPAWACSSDNVQYKSTTTTLSDKLDEIETSIDSKPNTSDLHQHINKAVLDGITFAKVEAWDNAVQGSDGASAYEIAVEHGYEGSETDWLASLHGADGANGTNGTDGTNGVDGADGASAYQIALNNGFEGSETAWLASLKGDTGETGATGATGQNGLNGTTVIVGTTTTLNAGESASVSGTLSAETNTLTLNFAIPKGEAGESGSSASITADEVLTKIKTVDGAESGLDADMLDGIHASGFATANHTHNDYATTEDLSAVETALAGKANTNHTHSEYASVSHTHTNYATTEALNALATTVDGKANAVHTHSGYASTADITTLQTALNGKANINHTHSEYASVDHVHSQYANADDVEALETSISGKANATHTHTKADITGLNNELSALADDIADANTVIAGKAEATHTHTLDDISETTTKKIFTADEKTKLSEVEAGANNYTHPANHSASMITGLSTVATSGDYNDLSNKPTSMTPTAHTHATSDVAGLETALSGKASTSHTHSLDDVSETATKKIMTADERTKLSGIATGANKTVVDTAMSSTSTNPVQNKAVNSALSNKVDKITGKGLSTNDYTTDEKTKLAGIATGANKYTHPSYTAKSSGLYKITVDSTGHISGATAVAKADITALGIPSTNTTYVNATTDTAGLMSAADKTKLNGIAIGANKTTVDAALSSSSTNPVQNKVINTALAGKASTSHNHNSAYIAKSLQMTADDGDVAVNWSNQDVVAKIKALGTGMYTAYAKAGTTNNPKTTEGWRFLAHKTTNAVGWVQAFGSSGSMFLGTVDSDGWKGWKCIFDADPTPLWTGKLYMAGTDSTPQTVTPSKKLSKCRNGWLLLWSDYNPDTSTANDADFATTIIPKSNATGGNWDGKSFLCDIPRYIGSNVNDVDTERRIMKILYIYDNYIKGSPNNNKGDRNDVVLRAVYEI